MGQYQQWLHYQEIDKRLSAQVEALEAELAQLQECLDQLDQQQEVVLLTDNPIIQALVAHLPANLVSPKSNARYVHVDNQAPPLFNRPELELLPEEMIAFFDEHEQTDPQLELPWWLRNIAVSSKDEQAGQPTDHNSIRTNRLVQRWIERWGRQTSPVLKSTENKEEGSGE
jgi:hypothetical protein